VGQALSKSRSAASSAALPGKPGWTLGILPEGICCPAARVMMLRNLRSAVLMSGGVGHSENSNSVSSVNSGQFALLRLTNVRFGDQTVGVLSGMEMTIGR